MGRQTAFPGIMVEAIRVQKPPFDEEGVVQEFVGRGATHKFEPIQQAADLTPESISNVLEGMEDIIGPLRDTYKIKYELLVRVPVSNPASKRAVSLRARTYARVKNPFEPDILEVSNPVKDVGLSGDEVGDIYRVTVSVTK